MAPGPPLVFGCCPIVMKHSYYIAYEALAKLGFTSAPGHPLSLAEFGIMFVCSNFRQSLLRPAAAYASGNLQNLPVLQVAHISTPGP